jgi:hypothetical protein
VSALKRGGGAVLAVALLGSACGGVDSSPGSVEGKARPAAQLAAAKRAQELAWKQLSPGATGGLAASAPARQILFGDLHVHTSYSWDGFLLALPLTGSDGAHPPADACDYARYCANLDFFALTDHAESLHPDRWDDARESLRQCNARAGDPASPDLVAFAGFEWSQVGSTPETHYGHRCVVFRDDQDAALPVRPIAFAAESPVRRYEGLQRMTERVRFFDPLGWASYGDYGDYLAELIALPACPEGVDVRALPRECREVAPTPQVLREKLDQWGFPALVIPHGTAWGTYTPATTSIAKHLKPEQYDPERQRLIEIMSGHGNSEQARRWREFERDARGEPICPAPTEDYLPCCWQAGEIMRGRCGDLPAAECEARVAETRRFAMASYGQEHSVLPDAAPEEWLDCGQCRDCFKPVYGLRPRETVQYAMALSNLEVKDADGRPLRLRYGFVASSDTHSARPASGYKQLRRRGVATDASGPRSGLYERLGRGGGTMEDPRRPRAPEEGAPSVVGQDPRVTSFLYPGGVAAVHADGRSRDAIWDAMQRREVYGTSGPRILLWFDLVNGPAGRAPMGSEVELAADPVFEVRAAGAFRQQPGCPDWAEAGLSAGRLERLCRGECQNPSDERHPVTAIEVVRIRPQTGRGQTIEIRIEDPWRSFPCPGDPGGCVVRFTDPEFAAARADTLYYVRALQEPTPAINGANLRTRFDANGRALATDPCFGGPRTPFDDDCLAPVQERAWSSPIFVDHAR